MGSLSTEIIDIQAGLRTKNIIEYSRSLVVIASIKRVGSSIRMMHGDTRDTLGCRREVQIDNARRAIADRDPR